MTLAFSQLPDPQSRLRSMDPRWKLISFFFLFFAVAVLRALPSSALALLVAVLLAWLGRLPRSWYLIRLGAVMLLIAPFVLLLPFVVPDPTGAQPFYQPSTTGLRLAGLVLCKGLTFMSLALTLLATTRMDHLLKAAHALWIPGIVIQLFVMTYRYLFILVEELNRMRLGLRVRGYRHRATLHSYRTVGRLTGALLVRSHDRGERVGQAMRSRGFDGHYRALIVFQMCALDVLAFLVVACGSTALLWWDWSIRP